MSEYTITPLEDPGWRLDLEEFMRGVQERWPNARVTINSSDHPMAADAQIPLDNADGGFGIYLDKLRFAVILEPADPDCAAEFIEWYLTKIPAFDPEVRLITEDFEVSMALAPDTTREDVLRFLQGMRRAT